MKSKAWPPDVKPEFYKIDYIYGIRAGVINDQVRVDEDEMSFCLSPILSLFSCRMTETDKPK